MKTENENTKELKATTQKSYYGKAKTITDGDIIKLKSYDTIICEYNTKTKTFKKIWQGWSKTTAQHINDFRKLFDLPPMSKSEWLEDINRDNLYKVYISNGFCTHKTQPLFDDYETAEKFADDLNARNKNGFWTAWAE